MMNLESNFTILYFIVGVLFTIYNWFVYKESEYQKCIDSGKDPEDGMTILYMSIVMIIWPIVLIYRIIQKIFTKK